jgi:hypothetical protein
MLLGSAAALSDLKDICHVAGFAKQTGSAGPAGPNHQHSN